MLVSQRRATRRLDYALAAAACALFLLIGLGAPGFWEPWESGLVQVAQFVEARSPDAGLFWVPQNDNHLVYKPLLQMWTLVAVHASVDSPSEFVLRLPGALLGLLLALTVFATMRRYYSRGAAWGALFGLLSLPFFTFGARLLAGGIWPLAGVALPLLLYLLALRPGGRCEKIAVQILFGLSWLFSLLAGGLFAVVTAALVLVIFLAWAQRLVLARVFVAPVAWMSLGASLLLGAFVFTQYLQHVAYVLEDNAPIDLLRVSAEIEAGRVERLGLRQGVLLGELNAEGQEALRSERFVVSVDGRERGTELWRLWAMQPAAMLRLHHQMQAHDWLDASGTPQRLDLAPSGTGAMRATLRFFFFDLFDPAPLMAGQKARVRSIVGVAPALGYVHGEPEPIEAAIRRWAGPLFEPPSVPPPAATRTSGRAAAQTTTPEGVVASLRNGQHVTLIAAAPEAGWSEVELDGGQSGFVRTEILEVSDIMPHRDFTTWVRHVGFGLFPWSLLLPLVLGIFYLGRRQGVALAVDEDGDDSLGERVQGFFLIWFSVALLAMGLGLSLFGQKAFHGVVPVAMGVGVLLGSGEFWRRVESAPFARKFLGFGAITLIAIFVHDYKEHPWLFIDSYLSEPAMTWDEKLRVMESTFKLYRAAVFLLLVIFLFNGAHFGARILAGTLVFLRKRFAALHRRLQGLRALDTTWSELSLGQRLYRVAALPWTFGLRYLAMFAWAVAQWLSRARVAMVLMAGSFAVIAVFLYLPAMSHHLTQKGLLERYHALAQGDEPLYNLQTQVEKGCRVYSDCEAGQACVRGRCRAEATSFYLGSVPHLRENELLEIMQEEERVFSIIPRDKLAAFNASFRKTFPQEARENLAVLDTRSSRFLLVSNRLREGEKNENYVGELILSQRPSPKFQPSKPVRFQNGLEFLGYDLDPEAVASGQILTITYYFHVARDITQDWQMFLHIDYPGNRINGDHYPGDGHFRTNTWLAGDYVKDVQKIEIDRGSSAGIYEMWFGFFSSGDNRLQVETGDSDGNNRVRMGGLQVTGGI